MTKQSKDIEPSINSRFTSNPEAAKHLPLTPSKLAILCVTLNSSVHGYEILKKANSYLELTGHQTRLYDSNMYPALKTYIADGLLISSDATQSHIAAKRTFEYSATELAREVRDAELRRLQFMAETAKNLFP